jgi:hypothetical protein
MAKKPFEKNKKLDKDSKNLPEGSPAEIAKDKKAMKKAKKK